MKIHFRYFHSQLYCFWRLSNIFCALPFWVISKYQLMEKLFRKDDSTLLAKRKKKRTKQGNNLNEVPSKTSWSVLFSPPQTSSNNRLPCIVYKNEPKPVLRSEARVPIFVLCSVKWPFEAGWFTLTSKSFANRLLCFYASCGLRAYFLLAVSSSNPMKALHKSLT